MTEVEKKGKGETGGVGSPLRPATAVVKVIVTKLVQAVNRVTTEHLLCSQLCFGPGDTVMIDSLRRQDSFLLNSAF